MGHALVVEDDADAAQAMAALIAREGHSVVSASSIAEAQRLLALRQPGLVLLDLGLPDGSGFRLLEESSLLGDAEVVLMTGQASLETSIQALRLGAADYLVKPVNPQHLRGLLQRLIAPSQLRAELQEITSAWRETGRFGPLVGASAPMQDVYHQIARVAGTAVSVFVHGESGTGKELVARAVHDLSRRREQPFLAINCAALSPHLIESEIFGHERGSFTGAERTHQGFFERAHGGTLFLDEVTEMPLELQAKLLRVLETGTFLRVGSTETRQTDVRIIAATNRDAAQQVANKALREDLYYRLNVFPIGLPPLRERGQDVTLLAQRFLQDLNRQEQGRKTLSDEAIERLQRWHWPGNVRELKNTLQRAWVMATGNVIDAKWLPGSDAVAPPQVGPAGERDQREATSAHADAAALSDSSEDGVSDPARLQAGSSSDEATSRIPVLHFAVGTPLAQIERERDLILATYHHFGEQRERTAAALGISLKTLYNRLRQYRLDEPSPPGA